MKHRILSVVIILTMLSLTLAGCSPTAYIQPQGEQILEETDTDITDEISDDVFSDHNDLSDTDIIVPLSVSSVESEADNMKKKDLDSSWSLTSSTVIQLNGTTAAVRGNGAKVSSGTVTITEAGTYVLTGTLSKGQILINAPKDDHVRLVLNGVDITADNNAAIYAASADKLLIILADGTNNTITDAGFYTYAEIDKEEPDAAIFSKCDLTINGTGTLTVNGNFKNGIKTKDDLVIVSGTFIVNAVNNGLQGKDSVTIADGKFDITAGNDGIKSSDGTKKGWVDIRGGIYTIKAANDGIQAETDLNISGGDFAIVTGGGSANAPTREVFGGGAQRDRRGLNLSPQQTPEEQLPKEDKEDEVTESMKGLKAGNLVYITGGDFSIDAEDDAVHSNNTITITAGNFEIKTGDDGIHADVNVEIHGGAINILASYEGIEGLTVTISGGEISIVSADDGINASNGEGKALNGGNMAVVSAEGISMFNGEEMNELTGRDGFIVFNKDEKNAFFNGEIIGNFNNENFNGDANFFNGDGSVPDSAGRAGRTFSATVNEDAFIRITGGTVNVYGGTDGLDSNGHIFIEGGTIKISGPSMIMEGAIDKDGDLIITGGEIITAGSWESPSSESTQPIILVSYTQQQSSDSIIEIKNANGEIILEYTSKVAFTMSGFTSELFEMGETYSLYAGGKKLIDIMLIDIITSISDDGGEYKGIGGMFNFDGNPGHITIPNRGR